MQAKPTLYYILLLALTLSGCMQPHGQTVPTAIIAKEKRAQYLQDMQHWQASGRIAISSGSENVNASFTWRQDGQRYRIHFSSPFSTESVTITGDDKTHKVVANNGESAEDVQLEQHLPFAQMAMWLKGALASDSTEQKLTYDRYNQIHTLQQAGWLIEFQTYTNCQPVSLPERLTIANGHTKAKLLIKNWQK